MCQYVIWRAVGRMSIELHCSLPTKVASCWPWYLLTCCLYTLMCLSLLVAGGRPDTRNGMKEPGPFGESVSAVTACSPVGTMTRVHSHAFQFKAVHVSQRSVTFSFRRSCLHWAVQLSDILFPCKPAILSLTQYSARYDRHLQLLPSISCNPPTWTLCALFVQLIIHAAVLRSYHFVVRNLCGWKSC